jgi:hypothetical protein
MKQLLLLTAFCTILLAGCGKKDDDNPTPNTPGGPAATSQVKATVGAAAFAATAPNEVSCTRVTSTDPEDAPARLVLRTNTSNANISLVLVKFTGTGTYQFKADANAVNNGSLASYSENGSSGPFFYTQFMPGNGVVGQATVTSWDAAAKRLQGTFTFTAMGTQANGTSTGVTKQVTNGTFDVVGVLLF